MEIDFGRKETLKTFLFSILCSDSDEFTSSKFKLVELIQNYTIKTKNGIFPHKKTTTKDQMF